MIDLLSSLLTTTDHTRQSAGLTYVYPVLSRRAGGLSIGINLNPNNACNWRCVYCQVPDLARGSAPAIDLAQLERELRDFVGEVLHGDYLEQHIPAGLQRLNDVAVSGNGEPTSAREFEAVIELVGRVRHDLAIPSTVKTVLITNGSLVRRRGVKAGLRRLAEINGEVWFKVDRVTNAGIRAVNSVSTSINTIRRNLETAARLCPTWIQTCMFALDGQPPSTGEIEAYVTFLADLRANAIPLCGVLLYGVARPSRQPEAPRLARLPESWFQELGERLTALGYETKVTP